MTVSVMIPTFRRPEGLRLAIQSVLAQSHRPDEIVVIDNSPEASARGIVENTKAVARCPVIYVHEPRPGVSNARNAGFAAATGRFIACLDDDEIASVEWLGALLATAESLDADVVFGPIRAEVGNAESLRGQLAARLYSRTDSATDRHLEKPRGCGNSLIDRSAFELPDPPFDPSYNHCGGEDDALFAALGDQGARFAWSARAQCVEVVGLVRDDWAHLLARSFAFGQGATQGSARAADRFGIVFWMAVGLAQIAVFAPLAALAALLRLKLAIPAIDKAVQGAGKLFWFGGLEPQFYGAPDSADPHAATPAGTGTGTSTAHQV